jgi:predicted TIM-barrel fold metal-dependent hydrolase
MNRNLVPMLLWLVMSATAFGGPRDVPSATYSLADFESVQKLDAHVHVNADDPVFLELARKDGFELLSINVDYPDFPDLAMQATVAHHQRAADPQRFHFATTFSMQEFGSATWTARTIASVDAEIAQGAVAVKVWKNIGMVEKSPAGQMIFLDDRGFDGVMAHLQARRVPLIAHQAEPRNCWLPLEQMTTENDRSYFREHPEYHMYLHPEQPTYEALLAARDRFVARHPRLQVVGAHLASLEWSVDELAKYLDAHPNATADMAARMTQVQYQSQRDYNAVRRFFIKYQHRILYGSDLTLDSPVDRAQFTKEVEAFWRSDWAYLATDTVQHIDAINADVKGLALPRSVIDNLYYLNAQRVFRLARGTRPAAAVPRH